jgi:hypothetical protein
LGELGRIHRTNTPISCDEEDFLSLRLEKVGDPRKG